VRLLIDLLLEHALRTRDREADNLAAQLVARLVALEGDLGLGRGEGFFTLEARRLARVSMIWLARVCACDSIARARVRASLITSSARLLASDRSF